MTKKIAIVGFGELGQQYYLFLNDNNRSSLFTYFDDHAVAQKKESSFAFNDYLSEQFVEQEFYISLGYHHLKKKVELIEELIKVKRNVPFFVHPTTFINASASIGQGSFIYPMCNIDKQVKIGKGVLINNSVCISHNSVIGNGCYISPGVIISGNVTIGERTFIGSGAIISNNVKIGSDVRIGIGTVVTKDISDGCSAIGNPFKLLKHELPII